MLDSEDIAKYPIIFKNSSLTEIKVQLSIFAMKCTW